MRSGRQGCLPVYVICGSSLTGDLPCAVWPAGVAACIRVLWLFPDWRLAECGLARLTYVYFDNLSYSDFCSTFSSLSPFNCGIKAKIVMDICGNENMNYTEKQVKGLKLTLFHC